MSIAAKLLLIVGLLAAGFLSGFRAGQHWESVETLMFKAEVAQQDLQAVKRLADKERAYRALEAQWNTRQKEIANDTQRQLDAARRDADAADRSAVGLRDQLAVFIADARARAAENPSAQPTGAPAGDALGVLADLLRKSDEAAGIYARFADASSAAGHGCEREYDSVTLKKD